MTNATITKNEALKMQYVVTFKSGRVSYHKTKATAIAAVHKWVSYPAGKNKVTGEVYEGYTAVIEDKTGE
jgi:hypothetical protein